MPPILAWDSEAGGWRPLLKAEEDICGVCVRGRERVIA